MSTWFQDLFGFPETTWAETRSRFAVEGEELVALPTGRRFGVGTFATPTLHALRERSEGFAPGTLRHAHVAIGDVLELHAAHEGAMFQAASQFNCLEFPGPDTTPEDGVTGYAHDPTQGPACSLAAAAATVYRNYFAPVGEHVGQTAQHQLNGLAGVLRALGDAGTKVEVRNGYTFSDDARLEPLNAALETLDRDDLMGGLRVGIQSRCAVTFASRFQPPDAPRHVSQAFCSALSCGYSPGSLARWRGLAKLVLDGAYEATLLAAAQDREDGRGSGVVWLTFLGGGVFGNSPVWIADAIGRALRRAAHLPLDVRVAHYRRVDDGMVTMIEQAAAGE
ncbi:MAG: hypothetical protein CMN30_29900 [Sandaracinus sp.]|nr:hypothetical protein [Sandaracinus sp.]